MLFYSIQTKKALPVLFFLLYLNSIRKRYNVSIPIVDLSVPGTPKDSDLKTNDR